jgi:farnesyl-diphosphate farnesyltransferase
MQSLIFCFLTLIIIIIFQAWGKYGTNQGDLLRPGNKKYAMACLNELVTNALHHIPDVLVYLGRLKNQSIFNFCAIPQVLRIVILIQLY